MTTLTTILFVILVASIALIAVSMWGIMKAFQSLVFVIEKLVNVSISAVNRFKGFGK